MPLAALGLHPRPQRRAVVAGLALVEVHRDHAGQPAWLVVACDLDDPLIAWSAARLQRFDLRDHVLRVGPTAAEHLLQHVAAAARDHLAVAGGVQAEGEDVVLAAGDKMQRGSVVACFGQHGNAAIGDA